MRREELIAERYDLALSRIREIPNESICGEAYREYFTQMAEFVKMMDQTLAFVEDGSLFRASMEERRMVSPPRASGETPKAFAVLRSSAPGPCPGGRVRLEILYCICFTAPSLGDFQGTFLPGLVKPSNVEYDRRKNNARRRLLCPGQS